jgi:arylsulfatase A-like enzyme
MAPGRLNDEYSSDYASSTLKPGYTPTPVLNRTRSGAIPKVDPDMKKPNILYIMADQMAAPALKMYDQRSVIKTPHIDALAAGGVVFDNAYCNAPLCAPSRFCLVSGQLPHKIGAYDNASQLSSEIPTYAHYLRREGFETVLAGKMHFIGPDQLHGYENRLTPDIVSLRRGHIFGTQTNTFCSIQATLAGE